MRRLLATSFLALTLLMTTPLSAAVSPPLVVLVVPVDAFKVDVYWTPPPDGVAGGYRVWGLTPQGVVLLAFVAPSIRSVRVDAGLLDYGVSTALGPTESTINWYGACVSVVPGPNVVVSEGVC